MRIEWLFLSEVQIFERKDGRTIVRAPEEDPRGMGVAGVLIQMFGLPSTLDLATQEKLDRRNELSRMLTRTDAEESELTKLSTELSELGLAYDARDPDYRKYLQALHRWEREHRSALDSLPLNEQDELMDDILDEIFGEQV